MKTESLNPNGNYNLESILEKDFLEYANELEERPNKELARTYLFGDNNENETEEPIPKWFLKLAEKP
jgi:hypothetical protein